MKNYSLKIFEDMHSCASYWEYLENAAPCHPFQSYIWCRALVDSFGEKSKHQLRICVLLGESNEPMLLVPLHIVRRGLLRVACFLDNGLADLNCPLLAPETRIADVQKVLQLLLASLHCDVLELSKIPPVLPDGRPNPFASVCKGKHTMFYYSSSLDDTWEVFLDQHITGSFRRKNRKAWNGLAQKGAVAVEVAETHSRALEMTKKILEFKLDWMRCRNISGVLETQAAQNFLSNLAEKGQAYLCALTLDGVIIAALWCQTRQERIYGLLTSYDMSFSKYSPGRLLLYELIHSSIEAGFREFGLGIGNEDFKTRLADKTIELYRHAAAKSLLGIPYVALFRIKDFASRNPRLRDWAMGLQKHFHSVFGGNGCH